MPEPVAPRPEPFVQPYLERRRSANPAWPGRRERGSSDEGFSGVEVSCCSCSEARVAASSASVEGSSEGAGGRL
jgi:hypothetical protein